MSIGGTETQFLVKMFSVGAGPVPWVTALSDDRFLVVWETQGIEARLFNAAGNGLGSFSVSETTSPSSPSATGLADGRFVVTWTSDFGGESIYGRLFDGEGNPVGDEFLVNTTAAAPHGNSAVTMLADGRFMVTWKAFSSGTGDDIRGRIFEADGSAVGNDFQINTTTEGVQGYPAVTPLPDGRFFVVWDSNNQSENEIFGRLFNADGSPSGGDFVVNTTTVGGQSGAAITTLADGRFFVSWQSDSDIRGRLFNADGSPVGNDFLVNTTAGEAASVAVTALADGRFFATWISDQVIIMGRLFNADGSAAGDDFFVNGAPIDYTAHSLSVSAMSDGRLAVAWQVSSFSEPTEIRGAILDPNVFNGTVSPDVWQGSNLFDDHIYGAYADDTLSGLGGNDIINGDTGTDNLYGGDGNDKLFGGSDGDLLDGGAGNDTLNGGTADDTMRGGGGNDTYFVDNAADVVIEAKNEGTDTVNSSVSFSLAGQYIENLNLTGAAAINGTGNSLNNTIKGNSANNVINGGTGADRMEGGGGDDRYYVDNAGDVVIEANGAGNDRVVSTVSFSLAGQYIDRLTLDGTANINGTGNSLNNGITGNSGNNTINGGTGNDTLDGGGGTDTLNGEAGNDTLTGGTGNDFFVFNTALNASTNVDTITDFAVDVDKMRLENAIFTAVGADLAANEFLASASGTATTSTQRVLYDTTDGRLYYDPDGNGAQARIHFATLDPGLALDHLDFVVI